jgi:hypothetical protein
MRRKLVEPAGSRRTQPRSGLPSLSPPVTTPPAALPFDGRAFEEHRRTHERRLSGRCRFHLIALPDWRDAVVGKDGAEVRTIADVREVNTSGVRHLRYCP